MDNTFKFNNIIININPDGILAVIPGTESEEVVVGERKIFKSAEAVDIDVYTVTVDTIYDTYVFEFDLESVRDDFIDSIYTYITSPVDKARTVTNTKPATTPTNSTTVNSKSNSKKPSK